MKKILLGTSALIGAALLASAAQADDPKVTIGGCSTFEAAWTNSDNKTGEDNRAFRNDNEIHFNIAGKTDSGLGYGAEIDLQADINGGGDASPGSSAAGDTNSGITAHRTYGWVQGDNWGHLEFGSNDGVARTLKVDASNIARATGGIDGDYKYFADVNAFTGEVVSGGPNGTFNASVLRSNPNFITAPRLPVENGPADGFSTDVWGNDDKITYYTPRFQGFQLGVSYAPSLTNRGELTSRVEATSTGTAHDIWEFGANYENQFDQIGFAAGATGELGNVSNDLTTVKVNDIRAWNGGAKVSFAGFSVAGSYGDWKNSLDVDGTDAWYYTGGLAYEFGPFGASVTYLNSTDKAEGYSDKFQDVSFGVDYKLAPGLTPFAEYTWYDIDPSGNAATDSFENKGSVVIIGSELAF